MRGLVLGGLASICLIPLSGIAIGSPVYDSHGFDPPTFSQGPLVGQDTTNGPWLGSGTGTATVQASVFDTSPYAVQVDRTGSDVRFAVLKPIPNVPNAIEVDWSLNVTQATGAQPYGPYFAVEAYDSLDTGGGPRLIGSAGIDAKTGEFLYQAAGSGILSTNTADTTFDLSANKFHDFRMIMDFNAQTYQVYVDNNLLQTEGFVDSAPGNPIVNFTDADLSALAASGDAASLAATGTAYYDNYVVQQTPEPTALALMAIPAIGLLRRRRVR